MSIPFAFFLLSSLLLWLVIGAKGHWLFKAAVISFVLYFCVSIDLSLENLLGWPSNQSLPEKFQVHWIEIREPNKRTQELGCIYVWATNSRKFSKKDRWDGWRKMFVSFQNYDPREPRSYRLPYSRAGHEEAQQALTLIRGGNKVGGGNRGGGMGKGRGEKGEGKGGKKNGDGGSLSRNGGIYFEKLPPPSLPDKG